MLISSYLPSYLTYSTPPSPPPLFLLLFSSSLLSSLTPSLSLTLPPSLLVGKCTNCYAKRKKCSSYKSPKPEGCPEDVSTRCARTYTCTHIHKRTYTKVHTESHIDVHTHTHIYIYIYIQTQIRSHTRTHSHSNAHNTTHARLLFLCTSRHTSNNTGQCVMLILHLSSS